MAQPKPVEKTPDAGAMYGDAAFGEFHAKFIQCRLAIAQHPLLEPIVMGRQFAAAHMPLTAWFKRAGLVLQVHQIVHKARRYPKVASWGSAMPMTFSHKRYHSLS